MNALLVYPEFPDTFWSFRHAMNFIGKRAFAAAPGSSHGGGDVAGVLE